MFNLIRSLLFFVLFFFLLGRGQNVEAENTADLGFPLEGEQFALIPYRFGFVVLTPKGYYDADGNFFEYSAPYPEELKKININGLTATQLNNTTYVLYPGGGMLFSFKEGALVREDLSFAHSNYYDGYFFSHKNHLYLLGGYGLWTTKSDLLRFNFEFKEWDKVETFGTYPEEGFWSMDVILGKEKLYVLHSLSMNTATQKSSEIDTSYVLDLNTMVWQPNYLLSKELLSRMGELKNYGVQNGSSWVLFPSDKARNYTVVDPVSGAVQISPEKDFIVSAIKPLFINNQLITLRRKGLGSPEYELKTYSYNPTSFTESYDLKPPNYLRNQVLAFAGLILMVLVFLWRIFINAKTFSLSKDQIGKHMRWVTLDEGEYFFLRKIAKYGNIKNSDIVHFYSEEGKSQDLFVKRKNTMIKNLEIKLQAKFKRRFFYKTEDPNDKRYYIYSIAPKVIIKYS